LEGIDFRVKLRKSEAIKVWELYKGYINVFKYQILSRFKYFLFYVSLLLFKYKDITRNFSFL
jgi:hypothetical protein